MHLISVNKFQNYPILYFIIFSLFQGNYDCKMTSLPKFIYLNFTPSSIAKLTIFTV